VIADALKTWQTNTMETRKLISSDQTFQTPLGAEPALKGPAWPLDFSQDIPEFTDEELEKEMELADKEQRDRLENHPSPSEMSFAEMIMAAEDAAMEEVKKELES
jgi:hypothetical protein